jgi:hypothetical protein
MELPGKQLLDVEVLGIQCAHNLVDVLSELGGIIVGKCVRRDVQRVMRGYY